MRVLVSLSLLGMLAAGCLVGFEASTGVASRPAPASAPPPPPPPPPAPAAAPSAAPAAAPSPRISGNNTRHTLPPGVYRGDMHVSGNHVVVEGAGPGQTVIEGRLLVSGNNNRVRGLSVTGETSVSGNQNKLEAIEYRGPVRATGNKNEY
jgi:hypothetical protein